MAVVVVPGPLKNGRRAFLEKTQGTLHHLGVPGAGKLSRVRAAPRAGDRIVLLHAGGHIVESARLLAGGRLKILGELFSQRSSLSSVFCMPS